MSTDTLSPSSSRAIYIENLSFPQATSGFTMVAPSSRLEGNEAMFKRLLDALLASVGILMISPILFVIAALVLITSPGPIFYKSLRIGKRKTPFYMYKFRTMVANADRMQDALRTQNQMNGQLFKLKEDSRITPLGKFLRKYSLDEFPQLINVIRGEMSLVGPRPYVPHESELFRGPFLARFDVMPGMTGPWQVNGRSDLSFDELCGIELDYVSNWSLAMDAILLLKTIPCVLLKKGAY